jgi:hypothetical protein
LAAVLVGDDPASVTYVAMKKRRSESAGIESRLIQLPASTTTEVVVAAVSELSKTLKSTAFSCSTLSPLTSMSEPRSRPSPPTKTSTG